MERLVVAIGSIAAGGWVGFTRADDGYRLACGRADGGLSVSAVEGRARADELLIAAIAHFEEALDAPPPELEATQADLGGLLRWLAAMEDDPTRHRLIEEAVDAVDDGLPADVVVVRLARVRAAGSPVGAGDDNERADLLEILVERCAGRPRVAASGG